MSPIKIKIFVGTSANHEDAESQAVLEYTLRDCAGEPLEITWMRLSKDPASPFYSHGDKGWQTSNWATPFSAFRWAVPELCGFEGKAIYMDSDMICMRDIVELWAQEFHPGKIILGKAQGGWRYCVSVWDCARAKKHLPTIAQMQADPASHSRLCQMLAHHVELVQPFAGNWNCLDGEKYRNLNNPEIGIIHYTDMTSQPHLKHAQARLARSGQCHWFNGQVREHPRKDLQELFDGLLIEAKLNGYPIERYTKNPLFGPYQKRSLAGIKATA